MSYKPYIFLSFVTFVKGASAPTHLLVTRAGPCNDSANTTVTVSELSLTMLQYDSLVSGVFNISEDLNNGWQIKATMQKCVDIRNIDTCDFFKSFSVVMNGCVDDDKKENVYSLLFRYSKPRCKSTKHVKFANPSMRIQLNTVFYEERLPIYPLQPILLGGFSVLKCPIQAGHYKIVNYPLFTEDNYLAVYESKISTSVFGYTLRLDGFSADRRKIVCIEAHLQLVYMQVHHSVENDIQKTTLGPKRTKSKASKTYSD